MTNKQPQQLRTANRKTAFILTTIAAVFLLGMVFRKWWLG